MKLYKIRSKTTGMYKLNSCYNSYNKTGKTWDTIGKLRSHLTMLIRSSVSNVDWNDIEIVEYDVVEASAKPPHEVITNERLLELLKR
jgi:hypothetical protein